MLNSDFTLTQARHLAGVLTANHGNAAVPLIRAAYLRVLSREPDAQEIAAGEKFLRQQTQLIGSSPGGTGVSPVRDRRLARPSSPSVLDAVVDFCHALLNSAEFLNVE